MANGNVTVFLKKALKYFKPSPDTFLWIFFQISLKGVLSLYNGHYSSQKAF